MNMSMGSCPDFGLYWYGLCPTSGLFPSTWPSVSKGVYPEKTIDFMSRQEPEHLLFYDCSVCWARSVHTTFDNLAVIGRGGIRKKKKKKALHFIGSYSIKFKLGMIFK